MRSLRVIFPKVSVHILLYLIILVSMCLEAWSSESVIDFLNSDTTQTFQELKLDGTPRYKLGRLLHLTLVVQDYEGEGAKSFQIRIEVGENSDEWNVCVEKRCVPISTIFSDWHDFSLISTNIGLRVGYMEISHNLAPVFKITIGFKTNGGKYIKSCGGSLFSIEKNILLFTISGNGEIVEKAIICGGKIVSHHSYR